MKKPGRNDPCTCGSGLKYKNCCLERAAAAPRFTPADRQSAFAKLGRFSAGIGEQERGNAYDEFWDEELEGAGELDEYWTLMSTDAFDMWFWFDRPLADGQLLVDRLLTEDPSVTAGERGFLELARVTCMRLYEVVDAYPGVSLALRDVLDDERVTVHEERGSWQLGRSDLLAARIIRSGLSGQPEMEAGLLPMSRLQRETLVSQLSSHRAEFHREHRSASADAFFKEMPPFFHSAMLSALLKPPIPQLMNTDGDDVLITRTHFDVRGPARLVRKLDASDSLRRVEEETVWYWSGENRKG